MRELDGVWSAIVVARGIYCIGAVCGWAAKKKKRTEEMAFGPALASGTWISIVSTGV